MTATMHKIAFIGVGKMGSVMAARLTRFDLKVYDANPAALREFAAASGARAAASAADAGRDVDALVTMLPDDRAVRSALLDAGGAASTLARGSIAIDMSTSDPRGTIAIGAALAARGIAYVDAPVVGGVAFAKDGTLDIMAGGEAAAVDRCLPVFEALGRRVYRCGALGSGHALKALANYVNACTFINVLEAMTIGRKFGLDTSLMTEAFSAMCAGRQHPLEKKVIPHVLTRRYATGMALGFIEKDLRIAVGLAQGAGAAAPLAERVHEIWAEAASRLGANVDQSEIVRYWEDADGVEL